MSISVSLVIMLGGLIAPHSHVDLFVGISITFVLVAPLSSLERTFGLTSDRSYTSCGLWGVLTSPFGSVCGIFAPGMS